MHHFSKSLPKGIDWTGPLVLSFLLKLFLSYQDAVINSDGVLYLQAAQMIAEGRFAHSLLLYPMPAYPFLIAVVHTVVPDWILAAKFIGLITAAAVTVPVYFLTRILFDRKAAFYAAMAAAVLPSLNDIAPDVIRDPCFFLFACWSVYWMVKASLTKRILAAFWAFVIGGAAILFRIEAISLLAAYLFYLAGLTIFGEERRHFAIKSLLFLMIPTFIGVVGLVSFGTTAEGFDRIDQLRAIGGHIISGDFFKGYQSIYAHLKNSERLALPPSGELYTLARHYMPVLYLIGMLEAFFKSLFLPFAASLWVARRHCLAVKGMPVVVLAILFHSLLVFIYCLHIDYLSSRYLLLSALLFLPLVGQGTVMLEDKCRQLRWQKTSLIILTIIFLVLPLYRSVVKGMGEDQVIALTGRWLSDRSEFHQVGWAVNDLRYYIYADREFNFRKGKRESSKIGRYFAENDYGALEIQARAGGKGVIIIKESKRETRLKPDFRHFRRIKQIESHQSIVSIYADPLVLNPVLERSEEIVE